MCHFRDGINLSSSKRSTVLSNGFKQHFDTRSNISVFSELGFDAFPDIYNLKFYKLTRLEFHFVNNKWKHI